jgi:hypothetical protein
VARRAIEKPTRFARLEGALLQNSTASGSWPHWLNMTSASTSLVGTAHGLATLRMRGYEFQDKVIGDGIRYLASQVSVHTKKSERGDFSRYPAYALWGLLRYPGALSDPQIFKGAEFSANWLIRRQLARGGWSIRATGDDRLSLPVTMPAVLGLERLAPYARGVLGERCLAAAARARAAVTSAAEGTGRERPRYWRQLEGGDICPGATSLAVLTLAGGDQADRDLANRGIAYLLANPERWVGSVHIDQQEQEVTWRIMSFSTGLRAVLHPCARHQPTGEAKLAVIRHMDSLWCEEDGAWATEPGAGPSTTGSYAVAAAFRALKNAAEYDPRNEFPGYRPATANDRPSSEARRISPPARRQRRQIDVWPEERRIEISIAGSRFDASWDIRALSRWALLEAVLKRQIEAAEKLRATQAEAPKERKSIPKRASQMDISLSIEELAVHSRTGKATPPSIRRTIKRINLDIAAASHGTKLPSFQDLIERMYPGDSRYERYGIEEVDVTFHLST